MKQSGWLQSRSKAFNHEYVPIAQTVQETVRASIQRLSLTSESPLLDAQVLLGAVLGRTRSWVISHPEEYLRPDQIEEHETRLQRLEQGEPLPYVLGMWEFFGLQFFLTPNVLIPRPETELLVETAIAWLQEHPQNRLGVDVGSGSGCIAVALALNCTDLKLIASDLSRDSLGVARRNMQSYGLLRQISLLQADLVPSISRDFDLICANLPYIPTQELRTLKVATWEPQQALDGGRDGLELINRLLASAPHQLAPGGLLLLEIEAEQGQAVQSTARRYFPEADILVLTDFAQKDRLLRIQS